ncbi:DHHW family protein [Pseudoflavonifractor gallinarum]|uniref:DHHW family protein n=1 Tax=Pseudoflavonifractor gallinarum TaxID=2779352 RepID=UPI0036F3D6F6
MSKRYCIFLSALFCAFLAVFLMAGAVSPDQSFSQLENRTLQQLPTPTVETVLNGKFMSDFETYTTDQFPGRDAWVDLKARTEKAMGKQENNSVYFCKEDTLITRFDTPDAQNVANNLSYVDQFAQKAGVPVYFSLIPGAAEIWSDRLPEGAPNASQKAVIDQAASTLKNALVYDTYSVMDAHSDEDIYYRTDHHWTSLGAYYGYTALMDALGMEAVPLSNYTKTTVSDSFYGTIFSSSGVRWVRPDGIDTYVPADGITVTSHTYDNKGNPVEEERPLYDTSFLSVKDKYSMFLGGNQPLAVVRTPHTDAPKLLIVRDSYTDSLVPFLTAHFSEIHLVDPRYYKLSVADYIQENGIDEALVLYSVSNFVTDKNLVWLAK